MTLIDRPAPFAGVLPHTSYFEIDSEAAGARYAVWVSVPPTYAAHPDRRYPAIYLPDGNVSVPQTAPSQGLLEFDPIHPIRPFIHVGVGYAGDDAVRQLAVRARDLLPPGEALPPGVDEQSMGWLVDTGILDREGVALYVRHLKHPAADRFLAFLTEELHPALARRFRIEPDSAGLFGFSYGGLFATYTALRRSPLFHRIGAGSPGIMPRVSKIFEMYQAELTAGADHTGRMLHLTVCAPELTAPSYYQQLVGAGSAEFIALAGQRPLKGLGFSSRIIEHESHASGFGPAWFSFLRTCYSAVG